MIMLDKIMNNVTHKTIKWNMYAYVYILNFEKII